ncbi:hypothetical protein [Streptomyces adelaidensis]|uniref:hypothetical protein n=1 Tax=Streptomyces adelaidensis TaxID=2796465 RepID=UPI001F3EAD2E|nr:hypothetical protein [Streptomyces adelaidensis]
MDVPLVQGHKHYSGTYWSATMRDHVIYESRLELSCLLFADFDPSVPGIVAQPFLSVVQAGGGFTFDWTRRAVDRTRRGPTRFETVDDSVAEFVSRRVGS